MVDPAEGRRTSSAQPPRPRMSNTTRSASIWARSGSRLAITTSQPAAAARVAAARPMPEEPPTKTARMARIIAKRLRSAEERKYGEHAAVVVLGVGKVELLEDVLDVALDRARAEKSSLAMARLERPSATSERTARSWSVSSSSTERLRPSTRLLTTSGSNAVPPPATRSTASRKSGTSRTRSFRR